MALFNLRSRPSVLDVVSRIVAMLQGEDIVGWLWIVNEHTIRIRT
jgi:hypothetical protein